MNKIMQALLSARAYIRGLRKITLSIIEAVIGFAFTLTGMVLFQFVLGAPDLKPGIIGLLSANPPLLFTAALSACGGVAILIDTWENR